MATDKIAPANAAKEVFEDLRHLVEAIDRRVPQDAADLRRRAIALMRAIEAAVTRE